MAWHQVNRQEELPEELEEVGDGSTERSSAIGEEGKLQFHSCLTLTECVFASLKVCNSKVCM